MLHDSNFRITIRERVFNGRTRSAQNLPFDRFTFSGGEVQVRLMFAHHTTQGLKDENVEINARLLSSDDIMTLLLLTDAIRRQGAIGIHLVCPYVPYARQDRACASGEAFASRVMARLLDGLFDSITIWDVHSDITLAMLRDGVKDHAVVNVPAAHFIQGHLKSGDIVVSPDKGAISRATECASSKGNAVLVMGKTRDPNTGYLSKFHIEDDANIIDKTADIMVVDDICDGGRTFIGVAKCLRDAGYLGKMRLFVTHGIFSAGFDNLLSCFDEVLTANCLYKGPLPDGVQVVTP